MAIKLLDLSQSSYMSFPGLLKPGVGIRHKENPYFILSTVAEVTNVGVHLMKAKTRKREVVEARQICMYLMVRYCRLSLKSIGEIFGNRDHSTVIHSKETVKDLCDSDLNFKSRVMFIENKIIQTQSNNND